MNRFPVLTNILPAKKKFMDKQRTVYLKATHKEKSIVLYWIEQTSIVGRKAYPCVFAEDGEVLAFLSTNKEASAVLEEKWQHLTPEIISAEYDVETLEEKPFFQEYHPYRDQYIQQINQKLLSK